MDSITTEGMCRQCVDNWPACRQLTMEFNSVSTTDQRFKQRKKERKGGRKGNRSEEKKDRGTR